MMKILNMDLKKIISVEGFWKFLKDIYKFNFSYCYL